VNPILAHAVVFFGAYAIGGIPFGLLIGKANGIDIRTQGSGNIGATNVLRCCGKPWGILCFFCDFLKGGGPVLLSTKLLASHFDMPIEVGIAAAVGAVCGHVFCPFLKFKGGKGIATAAGALIMLEPASVGIALLVWIVSLVLWRYVSLASIYAAISLVVAAIVFRVLCKTTPASPGTPNLVLLTMIGALAVLKHKSNITRLLKGEEPKIGSKKKADEGESSNESDSTK
jgi:glycerol-3-phosphate acyltransferase PlsY